MTTLNNDLLSQMIQTLSSLNLSPQELSSALQDPERMANLMGQSPIAELNSQPDIDDVKNELDMAEARWEQEARLTPRKPLPTQRAVLDRFNRDVLKEMTGSGPEKLLILKTFVGREKYHSTTPITQLTRISLRDMLAPRIHKGRYLICRIIFNAVRQVGLQLSIEDPHGQAILVTVYNFPGLFLADSKMLEAHFPLGTVMAIREPWMKFPSASSSQASMIRVDSPSDIVFLEPSDPILADVTWSTTPTVYRHPFTTAEQWNDLGRKHFKNGFFMLAALAWTRALEQDPSMHTLHLNRSQAYIRLGWFSAALADARHVLSSPVRQDMTMKKASYRAACAEYGIGCYSEAIERLKALEEDADIQSLIIRCQKRMKETTTGEYAWLEMFRAGQAAAPRLDVADFVSPAISVASFPTRGGGRGIRATRDIKTGELLVVAKPFASVFELPPHQFVFGINFLTRRSNQTSSIALISQVVAKIYGCPDESNFMYHLYCGPTFPPPPTAYPPPRASSSHPVRPLVWNTDIDVAKIDGIITYNTFCPVPVNIVTLETLLSPPKDKIHTPSAIYTLPSIFNHSCHANAVWRCFGDVMVIRAREIIPQGTEITLSYAAGDTYISRDSRLEGLLQKPCDCVMCASDRTDGKAVCENREILIKDFQPGIQRKNAAALAERLASTYNLPQHVPRPPVFSAYFTAMQITEKDAYRHHSRPDLVKLAIHQGFKALRAAGFTRIDTSLTGGNQHRFALPVGKDYLATSMVDMTHCVLVMTHISACFVVLSRTILAERWFRAAWWAHDTSFGGGKDLFDARLGTLVDMMPIPSMQYRWD